MAGGTCACFERQVGSLKATISWPAAEILSSRSAINEQGACGGMGSRVGVGGVEDEHSVMRHAHRNTIVNNKQGDRATATLFDWFLTIVPAWMGWSKAAGLDATEMFFRIYSPYLLRPNWVPQRPPRTARPSIGGPSADSTR